MNHHSVLNATGGTVIFFGADIGSATSLSIIEHGIDFTSAPFTLSIC